LGVAYQRALRDVKFQEEVYKNMYQLLEIARVDKIKDAVIISVLGKATLPEKKSFPRRGLSLIVITILAGLIFMGLLLVESDGKNYNKRKVMTLISA